MGTPAPDAIFDGPASTGVSYKQVVKAIFEVRRPQEETEFGSGLGANKTKERKLLWHGTKVSDKIVSPLAKNRDF